MSMPFTKPTEFYYDTAMREYPAPLKVFYWAVIMILFAFSKLMWRWKMEDAEKLMPRGEHGSVIICNHTSMAEVIAIVTHVYVSGRRMRPIMKSEFNKNKIIEWFFGRVGAIPVNRGTADMKALRRASKALQRGEDILIFPEGTRIRSDEQPVEVHGGFAIMAQMGKADVIPMAVCGFRDITPLGKKIMRPVKTWMRAGDRVSFDDAPADIKRRARTDWVEHEAIERMYAIRDALRNEHPGRR